MLFTNFNAKYIFHQEFMAINQKNKYAVKMLFQAGLIQRLPNVVHGPVNKNLKPMKHFKPGNIPLHKMLQNLFTSFKNY